MMSPRGQLLDELRRRLEKIRQRLQQDHVLENPELFQHLQGQEIAYMTAINLTTKIIEPQIT